MLDGILQRCDQRLIFGEIVRLASQILAQCSNSVSGGIVNNDAVAGRPRIAACATVSVRDEVVLGEHSHSALPDFALWGAQQTRIFSLTSKIPPTSSPDDHAIAASQPYPSVVG